MGYFSNKTAAFRYSHARPYFHPAVIERIRRECTPISFFGTAVDVGCGTGQSAAALKEISDNVIGTDISDEMLSQAMKRPGVDYVRARAENLPFPNSSIDAITVALAFHWLDRPAFLKEASRVLHQEAWLIIYNNVFRGTTNDNPPFTHWFENTYLRRYPTPTRNSSPLTDEEAARFGFIITDTENYSNNISFTADNLVNYLMTQTNVIAALDAKAATVEEIYQSLLDDVKPLFAKPTMMFSFDGPITYLRKLL